MEKIIILGSSGFLGRNLCQFFSTNSNFELFPLSRKDVDFTNSDLLKQKVLENFLSGGEKIKINFMAKR